MKNFEILQIKYLLFDHELQVKNHGEKKGNNEPNEKFKIRCEIRGLWFHSLWVLQMNASSFSEVYENLIHSNQNISQLVLLETIFLAV